MKTFQTIESWASSVGYEVEFDGDFHWHREGDHRSKVAKSVQEVIDAILDEIKKSYQGGK